MVDAHPGDVRERDAPEVATVRKDDSLGLPYGVGEVRHRITHPLILHCPTFGRYPHQDAKMNLVKRARTTLTVDERLLRAAKIEAAREGRRVYEVIEEALRDRYDLRAARAGARRPDAPDVTEGEGMDLAVGAVMEARGQHGARRAG